jgi:hypothetical protein
MSKRDWEKEDMSAWTVADLRDEGCAICIFTPEEIRNASPTRLEDRLCELGWEVIDDLQ